MRISRDTIVKVLDKAFSDQKFHGMTVTDYALDYGEPGYSITTTCDDGDETPVIVLGSWWVNGGDHFERRWPRLNAQLEAQGVELVWHDEWTVDGDASKAYRTQPDSMWWRPSYVYNEHSDMLTPDTDRADLLEHFAWNLGTVGSEAIWCEPNLISEKSLHGWEKHTINVPDYRKGLTGLLKANEALMEKITAYREALETWEEDWENYTTLRLLVFQDSGDVNVYINVREVMSDAIDAMITQQHPNLRNVLEQYTDKGDVWGCIMEIGFAVNDAAHFIGRPTSESYKPGPFVSWDSEDVLRNELATAIGTGYDPDTHTGVSDIGLEDFHADWSRLYDLGDAFGVDY